MEYTSMKINISDMKDSGETELSMVSYMYRKRSLTSNNYFDPLYNYTCIL